VNLFIVFENQ